MEIVGKMKFFISERVVKSRAMPKHYKILLVDDDADLIEELADSLNAAGYEVETFTDGDEAIRAASRIRPDIALLDLKMKGISGFRVAEEIRKIELLADIPIIAMTGYYTREEDQKLMKQCGIQACLFKPFSAATAARKLRSMLQGKAPN